MTQSTKSLQSSRLISAAFWQIMSQLPIESANKCARSLGLQRLFQIVVSVLQQSLPSRAADLIRQRYSSGLCARAPAEGFIVRARPACNLPPRSSGGFAPLGIMGVRLRSPLKLLSTILPGCCWWVSGSYLYETTWCYQDTRLSEGCAADGCRFFTQAPSLSASRWWEPWRGCAPSCSNSVFCC